MHIPILSKTMQLAIQQNKTLFFRRAVIILLKALKMSHKKVNIFPENKASLTVSCLLEIRRKIWLLSYPLGLKKTYQLLIFYLLRTKSLLLTLPKLQPPLNYCNLFRTKWKLRNYTPSVVSALSEKEFEILLPSTESKKSKMKIQQLSTCRLIFIPMPEHHGAVAIPLLRDASAGAMVQRKRKVNCTTSI